MIKNFNINYDNDTNTESNIFVLISLLHINGFINNDSITDLFKLLRAGKIKRNVNTYYSKINKKWYNNENISDVYEDILNSKINTKDVNEKLRFDRLNKVRVLNGLEIKKYKTSLNFEEVMKYLNLYLNKNKNYCIDHLYHVFIKPNILSSQYNNLLDIMFDYDFSSVENKHKYHDDYYCCEYCCGDYDSWYNNRHEVDYRLVHEDIAKIVSEFLNTKREKYKDSYKEFVI